MLHRLGMTTRVSLYVQQLSLDAMIYAVQGGANGPACPPRAIAAAWLPKHSPSIFCLLPAARDMSRRSSAIFGSSEKAFLGLPVTTMPCVQLVLSQGCVLAYTSTPCFCAC